MILLIQNTEDYNNDFRVSLQAFYGGERIIVPEIFDKKPELKNEVDKIFVADIDTRDADSTKDIDSGNDADSVNNADAGKDTGSRKDANLGKYTVSDTSIEIRMYAADPEEAAGSNFIDIIDGVVNGASVSAMPVCSTRVDVGGDGRDKSVVRNPLKLAIYEMLSRYTGRVLPWGSLTGIRPTKIAVAQIEDGADRQAVVENYIKVYGTSRAKAELAFDVAGREKKIIDSVAEEDEYCLYIGIPFCPTRCLYCSFTSYPIAAYKDKVEDYLDALEKEMTYVAEAYRGKRLISIYVGGGTPSSISAENMERLCSMVESMFDMSHVREFTIEAGRPDSTTYDKLLVMKKHGVTRISINPQTMNEQTLRTIGRAHTPEQTRQAMAMARKAGFDNINMDLIVGLPGEDTDAVENTLRQIKELSPESLTVHTLAVKRAAKLNIEMDRYKDQLKNDIESQLDAVTRAAGEMGLEPYYLYRQKNMTGNLENVGYSKEGLECLYNILIMEERTDIVGLGAGSSSKLVVRPGHDGVTEGTRIDRIENCKSVDDYISRIDEMIARKKAGFIWE